MGRRNTAFISILSFLTAFSVLLLIVRYYFDIPILYSATVKSGGTYYPSIQSAFFPVLLSASLGFVVIWFLGIWRPTTPAEYGASGTRAATALGDEPAPRVDTRRQAPAISPAVLLDSASVLLVGFVTAYVFSSPPHLSPSNFRVLWVDPILGHSPWISTIYFLPTLFKTTFIQYFGVDYTPLFVAFCVAISTLLFFDSCRQLQFSRLLSIAATLSFIFSSHLLVFYQPSEDVTFINIFSLLTVNAFIRRRAFIFGLAIAALLLSRPEMFTLPVALFVADSFETFRRSNRPFFERLAAATTANRFLLFSGLLAIGVVAPFHLVWLHEGIHFLQQLSFTSGRFQPIPIDGFTLGTFSGAYFLHALWIFPPVIVAATVAAAGAKDTDFDERRRLALAAMLSFLGAIAFLEIDSNHMPYFNFRYTVYAYPMLLLSAWSFLPLVKEAGQQRVLFVALAGSVLFGGYYNVYETWKLGHRNSDIKIFDKRAEIRNLAANSTIIIDKNTCRIQRYSMIAAILLARVRYENLDPSTQFDSTDLVVFCGNREPPASGVPALKVGDLNFYKFP